MNIEEELKRFSKEELIQIVADRNNLIDYYMSKIEKKEEKLNTTQKEIEKKDSEYEDLQTTICEVCGTEDCPQDCNVCLKSYKSELEKKDKIIDEMAEHIVSSAIVDDTVCSIKCDCETDILEDCTYEKMLSCTKQYFAKKVKGK